ESMLSGKFTIGADANVAAGPVGRETSATTDINLTSEIYSYSRSRGVFLGVSIDGSAVEIDNPAVSNYYRSGVPQEAQNLINTIVGYADTTRK
ncbi:MAG: lipid-binding SYLF domain-containing protein, partial [Planctomycetia bacterium]|nr:lipid-binding SYLF domain-containing protein [Planctomycetia bacterium]